MNLKALLLLVRHAVCRYDVKQELIDENLHETHDSRIAESLNSFDYFPRVSRVFSFI